MTRFELKMEENKWYFYDNVEEDYIYSKHSVCRLLNNLHQENHYLSTIRENQQQMILKLKEENEQLKMRLLNCEQKKNDNGGFQVWEVPPIQKGMRIKISTGEKDE